MQDTETTMCTIINQLPDLEPAELAQVAGFIYGLKMARSFKK